MEPWESLGGSGHLRRSLPYSAAAGAEEIYFLQSLAGQAGLPRLYCDLRCCLRQEQNTRWPRGLESRARRLGSSTSVLLSKHRVFHHKFSDIACVLRPLRGVISNHELHYLLDNTIGYLSEDVCAAAQYSAPTSVLVHTVKLVARGIEEKMGQTFAYMPLRAYTRLAEQSTRSAADLSCGDRRPDVLLKRQRHRQ